MGGLNLNQQVFDISVTICFQCIISQLIAPRPVLKKDPVNPIRPGIEPLTPKRQPDALTHRPRDRYVIDINTWKLFRARKYPAEI